MKSSFENNVLTVYPSGRIDSTNVNGIEKDMLALADEYQSSDIVIDCSELTYIASAGLRVILKLGKKAKKLAFSNVSRDIYEILDTTGFTGMFDTKRKMREISVDGCKIVGAGLSSTVYRTDADTVVKVFSKRISLDRIYSETASAKKSFVAGIPTAIPFDVVKVGDCYGTCFELLDADTLSQNFMDHPDRFDELMEKYVSLLKKFHSTPAVFGMPDIVEKYHSWCKGLGKFMTDDELCKINKMIDAVPRRDTMIHVDCHSRNIMVQNGKLIFVDMADVSVGHPLFDIGAEYFHYCILRDTMFGAKLIFGVEPEDTMLPIKVWDALVDGYFANLSSDKRAEARKMLRYFGCLRCLIMVAKHSQMEKENALELIDRQRKDLLPYADEATELFSRADEFFI